MIKTLVEYPDKHVIKNFEASHNELIDIPHSIRVKVQIK